jgi:hypothetical protein
MKEGSFPDVRNRALIYWRILSGDANVAKEIVSFPKKTQEGIEQEFDPGVLDTLLSLTGTASGILHILPTDVVSRVDFVQAEEK